MKIVSANLYKINLPLLSVVKTSYGEMSNKNFILVELENEAGIHGYGECSAFSIPFYTEEFRDGAYELLKKQLIPLLLKEEIKSPEQIQDLYSGIKRNNMAKSVIDNAIWDLFAQTENLSLANYIGGTKKSIQSGISIGIQNSPSKLIHIIKQALNDGYERIKVKIKPGKDYEYLKFIRQHFPSICLMADANCAYSLKDIDLFKKMDELNLLMIEQPLEPGDLIHHAKLQSGIKTPICLDESINSLSDAEAMLELGSGKIINIKVSKVGGITSAKEIQNFAMKNNIQCWCGGMYSSGVARAVDVAIATLPGYTLPNDISASNHYFSNDIISPGIELKNGNIEVPTKVGLGVNLNWKIIKKYTIQSDFVK